jgi:hypothetical protein
MGQLGGFVATIQFTSPLYFWLGAPLVLLLVFLGFKKRAAVSIDLRYWMGNIPFDGRRIWLLSILVIVASFFLTGALSQPQGAASSGSVILGKPVMAVVDVSGSMEAKPVARLTDRRTNYEKARDVMEELINRAPAVDFGLLMYSTESYIARYFAYKPEFLSDSIDNANEIKRFATGTQTAAALAKARQFLNNYIEGDKAIILISDLDADLLAMGQTAEELQEDIWAGIKVYVIVVGEEGDAATLPQVEGVEMVDMYDEIGLSRICQEVSMMQSSVVVHEQSATKRNLMPFLITPTLLLIALYLILSETRFRKLP